MTGTKNLIDYVLLLIWLLVISLNTKVPKITPFSCYKMWHYEQQQVLGLKTDSGGLWSNIFSSKPRYISIIILS